jgi:small-conductance mechanosensitive channel
VKRLVRLVVPLLASLSFFAVYYFISTTDFAGDASVRERAVVLKALLLVASLSVAIFVVRLVDLVAFEIFRSRGRQAAAPGLLRQIVALVLYAIYVIWALTAIFDVKNITAVFATGTVLAAVLGLALQDTLGNLFAGIALHMDDTFEAGDVIRSGEFIGVVEATRWRGVRLRTFNNNIVILPNATLARERLEVFPRNSPNARLLQLHVDYNVPPAFVISVLSQAVSNVEGVSHLIPALARVAGFGDFALTYEIKYFMTDYSHRDRIDAEIRKVVWYALRRNGIAIPLPVRSIQQYTPPVPRAQPGQDEILTQLTHIGIFSPLSPEALGLIAGAAHVHSYAGGETIIQQGAAGESMFIVYTGEVAVRADDRDIARLAGGDFFGEMALLTGERRAADVVAMGDVTAVEITREALEPVLRDNPELAAAISARVMERRDTLALRRDQTPDEHASVLSRVRAFFKL